LSLGLVGLTGLTGCGGDANPTHELAAGELVPNEGEVMWDVPTRSRLRVTMPGAATMPPAAAPGTGTTMPGMDGEVPPAVDTSMPSPLTWTVPAGWDEIDQTSMRLANFHAGDPSVQCYVTLLGGDGGGVLGNVNRWRGQLKLDPVGPEAIDAMPRIPQLKTEAVLIEIDGESDAMLATISLHGATAVFVKMLGPKELVLEQKQHFIEFCGSLEFAK